VNTATNAAGQGIGFAIPSLIAKRIAQDLIAGRKPGHPYMGVCYQSEDSFLAAAKISWVTACSSQPHWRELPLPRPD